jgi:hypothetical protein
MEDMATANVIARVAVILCIVTPPLGLELSYSAGLSLAAVLVEMHHATVSGCEMVVSAGA